jgi:hypothetical protein
MLAPQALRCSTVLPPRETKSVVPLHLRETKKTIYFFLFFFVWFELVDTERVDLKKAKVVKKKKEEEEKLKRWAMEESCRRRLPALHVVAFLREPLLPLLLYLRWRWRWLPLAFQLRLRPSIKIAHHMRLGVGEEDEHDGRAVK